MIINWYPGHMAKARRLIEANLKVIDVVIELVDARIPLSSLNPELQRLTASKPRLYVMNKADLADPALTKAWQAYFRAAGAGCVAISAKQKADMIMKMIPLYLPAIFTPLSQQLKKCYTKFIATVQDGGKTGVKTGIKHAYKQSALWVCFCPCFHIGQRAP